MICTVTALRTKTITKKDGSPATMVFIKTQEHGDKELSGFLDTPMSIGQSYDLEVSENGKYTNFKLKRAQGAKPKNPEQLERIEKKIDFLTQLILKQEKEEEINDNF